LNVEWFMARRLLSEGKGGSTALPIVRIAIAGIALGVCVMLLAVFVTSGFKREIREKLTGFMAHLNVLPDAGERVRDATALVTWIEGLPGVNHAYGYVEKTAVLKGRTGEKNVHGALARGLDTLPGFFREYLAGGTLPDFTTDAVSDAILLSTDVAGYLEVTVGDRLTVYFPDEPRRPRRLEVRGTYNTGFKEYDDATVLVDQRLLLRVNGWGKEDRSGIAVVLEEGAEAARVAALIEQETTGYAVMTLEEIAPQIFDWLELLDMNVWIILILLVTVAGFNMVSGLLVLILDKTAMIGVLKALGCRDFSLRLLFLHVAAGLVARGMLWGNALAFALAGMQYHFRVVTLDPETYYMSAVPLSFRAGEVLLLNAGVLVATVLILVVPSMLAARVEPARSMKFE
jgi:lipoprotein-releasing system permease protein